MEMTQEQKDIKLIQEDIKSIRVHFDKFKAKEEDAIIVRSETNRKLDLLVNALTDNDFNGKNGYLTRLNKMETMVQMHELYWKILFTIIMGGGILVLAFRFLIYK
jgi:hypothetical protein